MSLYTVVKPVAGIALRWYYRSISVAGAQRIPATGPVFLAPNHPNAMVDALVVAWTAKRQVGFTAKSTIFSNPLLSAFLRNAGVIPLKRAKDMVKTEMEAAAIDPARNAESFRAVSEAMAEGKAVVVFPEGISHDAPQLAPLRTGLARMALQARDTLNVRGIQIIPVGLLFEKKEQPRSAVLVQIGAPIYVDAIDSDAHAVEGLTALITERLQAVTLNFDTPEDAARIETIGETLATLLEPVTSISNDGPSLSARLTIVRRAERARKALQHSGSDALRELVANFEQRLESFRVRLAKERIDAADLFIDVAATPGVRFAIREGLLAAILIPVSWFGQLTHWVPLRIARWLALRGVRNRDEPAMKTIIIGLVLVLLSYAIQTTVVGLLFGFWWALLFLMTLVPSASSEMRYGDRSRRRAERMRAYLLFRRHPALRNELLAEADWLRKQAGAIEQQLHPGLT